MKTINLTENDISELILECINKIMLNESMTGITFHFTNYQGLIGILSSNSFRLADQEEHYQRRVSERKPYYMCVTRQKYGDTGYGHERDDFDVRITLNGRKFNQRYKTIVYDYYANNSNFSARKQELYNNGGILPYKQGKVENEERILSEDPIIPNASRYILRIDIFDDIRERIDQFKDLLEERGLSDVSYWYRNKEDFNLQNRKCVLIKEMKTLDEEIKERLKSGEKPEDIFDEIGDFHNGYAYVTAERRLNFIDKNVNTKFPTWFSWDGKFEDGLSVVTLNDKSNIIDVSGNFLLDEWFDSIGNFVNGFAVVESEGERNWINKDGKILSDQWFDWCNVFEYGVARVKIGEEWNFVNTKGEILLDQWMEYIENFDNGFAEVEYGGKANMFNKYLELVLDKWYDYVYPLGDKLIRATEANKGIFLYDTNGKQVSDIGFTQVFGFTEGRAVVVLGAQKNFIDENGKLISDKWFDDVSEFKNGLADVYVEGRKLTIDVNGNYVNNESSGVSGDFKNGYSIANIFGKKYFIDKNGNPIINKGFEDATDFIYDYGFAQVKFEGKWYWLDTNGNFYDANKNIVKI